MEYRNAFGRINLEEKDLIPHRQDSKCDDLELIERVAAGDKQAFSEIMKRYRFKALNFAFRYLGDFDDAEDITQDCFVKIYFNSARFDKSQPFAPWFYRILVNCCRDRLRQKARFANFLERFKLSSQTDDVSLSYNQGEYVGLVEKALLKLSPSKREIIALRFNRDLSYQEIAEALGISEGTVMSRLYRAKKELKKILKVMGIFK